MLELVILLSCLQSKDLHNHNTYICIMFVHFLLSLSNNVVIKLDAIYIFHFFIIISCEIRIRKCLRSIRYKFLVSKSRNVSLV